MSDFYSLIHREINTEKSQIALDKFNIRTFVCLPHIRKNAIGTAFKKHFGYNPDKINILTYSKILKNKRTRSTRIVDMKKVMIYLPKGKDLTPVKKESN